MAIFFIIIAKSFYSSKLTVTQILYNQKIKKYAIMIALTSILKLKRKTVTNATEKAKKTDQIQLLPWDYLWMLMGYH